MNTNIFYSLRLGIKIYALELELTHWCQQRKMSELISWVYVRCGCISFAQIKGRLTSYTIFYHKYSSGPTAYSCHKPTLIQMPKHCHLQRPGIQPCSATDRPRHNTANSSTTPPWPALPPQAAAHVHESGLCQGERSTAAVCQAACCKTPELQMTSTCELKRAGCTLHFQL